MVEKCLVAGTCFSQQAVSQNITGRSVGAFQQLGLSFLGERSSWYAPGLLDFARKKRV